MSDGFAGGASRLPSPPFRPGWGEFRTPWEPKKDIRRFAPGKVKFLVYVLFNFLLCYYVYIFMLFSIFQKNVQHRNFGFFLGHKNFPALCTGNSLHRGGGFDPPPLWGSRPSTPPRSLNTPVGPPPGWGSSLLTRPFRISGGTDLYAKIFLA